jgi:hypothetical protein
MDANMRDIEFPPVEPCEISSMAEETVVVKTAESETEKL